MKLAVAVLLIFTLPAQAEELSPWFGSAETGAFRIQQAAARSLGGLPAAAAMVTVVCETGICPDGHRVVIDTQGLAAAP